jgi:hypothetical protein
MTPRRRNHNQEPYDLRTNLHSDRLRQFVLDSDQSVPGPGYQHSTNNNADAQTNSHPFQYAPSDYMYGRNDNVGSRILDGDGFELDPDSSASQLAHRRHHHIDSKTLQYTLDQAEAVGETPNVNQAIGNQSIAHYSPIDLFLVR